MIFDPLYTSRDLRVATGSREAEVITLGVPVERVFSFKHCFSVSYIANFASFLSRTENKPVEEFQ